MNKLVFEKTTIIARQIILGFVDINLVALSLFDSRKFYKIPLEKYENFRIDDKEKFSKELYRLAQKKFIKKYYEDKKIFIELTPKGKTFLRRYLIDQLKVNQPGKWDKKWRLVIFDIPKQKNKQRDILRLKLIRMGFIELQQSVYVFPFDCLAEINFLKNIFSIQPNVQYIVAEQIETEVNLIKNFLDRHILEENML